MSELIRLVHSAANILQDSPPGYLHIACSLSFVYAKYQDPEKSWRGR
jgi:hypothetical protein